MSKSWREPSKGFSKCKGFDRRKEDRLREDKRTRQEIKQIVRRTGEKLETFMN